MFPIKSWNKYKDVLADKQLTNNAVESFNATWTDGMERRPSLYSVLDGFLRKEGLIEMELREECLDVGVNAIDKNKSRNQRNLNRRKDLKALCSNFSQMPIEMYMQSIVAFMKNK